MRTDRHDFDKMVSGLIKEKVKKEKDIKRAKKLFHNYFWVWAVVYFTLLIGWILFK